ncbi:hypothetical protein L1987_18965 [Smallanthus sonchifolius]|uniref:Uncharacterized protein n=1 Tax=Smallanthus sonchifolius TaxID=185202 RepID=A0ACB9J274_9ASTR|nr:hypothetical protein L1987_18965 [Smallanthus sonchifolius]
MDRNIAVVAIFTLLFAVSTARISLNLTPTNCKVEDLDLAVVPTDTKKSRSRRSPPFRPRPSSLAFFVGFFCFYAIVDHGWVHWFSEAPILLFWTMAACGFMAFYHILPLKDEVC